MQQQTHFRTWELALLPARTLVLNMQDAILSELSRSPCAIVTQLSLYPQESELITALLNAYPRLASHATLYAAVYALPLEQTDIMIERATLQGELDHVMNAIRILISRARPKLHAFGLDVASVRREGKSVGYIITTFSESTHVAET